MNHLGDTGSVKQGEHPILRRINAAYPLSKAQRLAKNLDRHNRPGKFKFFLFVITCYLLMLQSTFALSCSRIERARFIEDSKIAFGDMNKFVGCGVVDDVCNFEIGDICVISHSKNTKLKNVISFLCKKELVVDHLGKIDVFVKNITQTELGGFRIFLESDNLFLNGSCFDVRSRLSSTRLGVLLHVSFAER